MERLLRAQETDIAIARGERVERHDPGVEPVVDRTSTRIVLADTPWSTAYIERLTGDYYVIDRTGTVLSVWGRCGRTHPLQRLF